MHWCVTARAENEYLKEELGIDDVLSMAIQEAEGEIEH